MWKNQLKIGSKSFTMPKVKLNVNPDEDRDCCEEAKKKYLEMHTNKVPQLTLKAMTEWPCENFKSTLQSYTTHNYVLFGYLIVNSETPRSYWIEKQLKVLDEWEECDNVENST